MILSFVLKMKVAIANEDLIKFMYALRNSEEDTKFHCKYNQLPPISENTF